MVLFDELARLAETLAVTASRLAKRAAIAAAIMHAHAADVADRDTPGYDTHEGHTHEGHTQENDAGRLCLYLSGEAFAASDPRRLNAGGALLSRAVKTVSGCTDAALTAAYRRHGDLGAAAQEILAASPLHAAHTPTLTLQQVAAAFDSMAAARTTAARSALVESLLTRATPLEAKYLLKLMLADMRIGVKQALVEEAIAVSANAAVAAVRHAVMLEADLSDAVARAFAGTLDAARMTLFHPLGFMLASPVETPEEALARFTAKPEAAAEDVDQSAPVNAFLEDKYDGMRAQLHCGDPAQPGRVAIYSRSREDVTASFPELAEAFEHVTSPTILDGEVLGWDPVAERALPFAVMGQRIGRKRVDDALRQSVPVVFMAFDVLFAEGELLLPKPLQQRRALLENLAGALQAKTFAGLQAPRAISSQHSLFAEADALPQQTRTLQRLRLSPSIEVNDAVQIDRAYAEARARGNEGVMLKAAESPYLPGRRGLLWVKLKRELATLDVVVTGAEFGHGRRAQVLSDYTFAVRADDGELLNVGKAYSGLTDVEIAELTVWLKAHTLEDHGHFRTVEPLLVLEVAFNNVMRSERHGSGFALRFPRILRLRPDKPLAEIDTLARVEEIYQSQPDKVQSQPAKVQSQPAKAKE
jgi:DNA ligase-1